VIPRPNETRIPRSGSGHLGTGSSDPCSPAGDGAAISHSAPLDGRTLSFCPPDDYHSPLQGLLPLLGASRTKPGDGEHWSPPEPAGGPHLGVQGAKPPHYPEAIAQSHMSPPGPSWELGFQGHYLEPPAVEEPTDPDPQEVSRPADGIQLTLACPAWGVVGECEQGHHYAKELICNREWCQFCGGDGGKGHRRRKAAWMPRARQLNQMGKFVITVPPEVRDRYRDPRKLAALGVSFKRMFQDRGFSRGLRRFHFFGEDHPGHGLKGDGFPVYHPHLEAIVEAGHLAPEALEGIKRSVANILGVDLGRVNVHYEYTRSRQKKLHMVSYALRPTFESWEWDEELAYNLVRFKNALTWGKWKDDQGEWLPPVWDVPDGEEHGQVLEALEHGRCPVDGSAITWGVMIAGNLLVAPWWGNLGGGYWSWTGLARDGPTLGADPGASPPG